MRLPERFKEYGRLLSVLKGHTAVYSIGVVGDSLVAASFPLFVAYTFKAVFDAVSSGNLASMNNALVLLAVNLGLCGILSPLFGYLYRRTVKICITLFAQQLQRHVQSLPMSFFETRHSGEIVSSLSNDIHTMEKAYIEFIRSLVFIGFSGLGSIAFMLYLDWRFTILLLVVASSSFWILKKLADPLRAVNDQILEQTSKLTESASDLLAGFSVMKHFGIERQIGERFDAENRLLASLNLKEGRIRAFIECSNFFQGFLSYTGMILLGMLMVMHGQLELGTLIALVQLQSKAVSVFFELGNTWAQLQQALSGAARIFRLLDEPVEPEAYEYTGSRNDRHELLDARSGEESPPAVAFDHLNFAYPGEGRGKLDQFTITVQQGKWAAIVGPSGSGKSTLLKLLLGFYPPAGGDMLIGGKSASGMSLKELRKYFTYVPQDAFIFEGTVYENLLYGNPQAEEADIVEAARRAHAYAFIMELPQQFDTVIGETGLQLSGGQRQRIALARAMLRKAPILLLDEATSALDNQSESAVQQAINDWIKDGTLISIAHRLSTVEHADRILCVEDGKLTEQGTFDELLARQGTFRRLYNA